MRISDWSSDVCSSDLNACSGATINACQWRGRRTDATATAAAARTERCKQAQRKTQAHCRCIDTQNHVPTPINLRIKSEVNWLTPDKRSVRLPDRGSATRAQAVMPLAPASLTLDQIDRKST